VLSEGRRTCEPLVFHTHSNWGFDQYSCSCCYVFDGMLLYLLGNTNKILEPWTQAISHEIDTPSRSSFS